MPRWWRRLLAAARGGALVAAWGGFGVGGGGKKTLCHFQSSCRLRSSSSRSSTFVSNESIVAPTWASIRESTTTERWLSRAALTAAS